MHGSIRRDNNFSLMFAFIRGSRWSDMGVFPTQSFKDL